MHTRQLPVGSIYGSSARSANDLYSFGAAYAPDARSASYSAYAPAGVPAQTAVERPGTHFRGAPVIIYQQIAPTNASAIVALVFCLISFTTGFFLAGIVGIVFGHVARSQIKARGDRGNGMAVAALWFGYLSVLFWIAFCLVYFGIIALLIGVGVAAESGIS